MDWPDKHHFDAAVGWLELGNAVEARAELSRLSSSHRAHPDVLALEWQLFATNRDWRDAAAIGESWVAVSPETPEAWIQRSYALHELQRTQEAWDKLLPAATLFPKISTIAYNLACYACQLGELDAARRWLLRAMKTIDDKRERRIWRIAAQKDHDLKPLWQEINDGQLG